MQVQPIGVIHSPFKETTGTPIQASVAQDAEGIIEVLAESVLDVQRLQNDLGMQGQGTFT